MEYLTTDDWRARRFRGWQQFCQTNKIPYPIYTRGAGLIRDDIEGFEGQEHTYGTGKTRRPSLNDHYFTGVWRRAKELVRRDDEDSLWG